MRARVLLTTPKNTAKRRMASNNTGTSTADPKVVKNVVDKLKRQGLFDQFRKECLADVDTKPAYQNLRQRVENYVNRFLSTQTWSPDLNKNQMRDSLRKYIQKAPMFTSGIDIIVEQVVNPKVNKDFKPQIEKMVCEYLGIDIKQREDRQRQIDEAMAQQRRYIQHLQQQAQQAQQMANNQMNNQMLGENYPQFPAMPTYSPQQAGIAYPPSLMDIPTTPYRYDIGQVGQMSQIPGIPYPTSTFNAINQQNFTMQGQTYPQLTNYQAQTFMPNSAMTSYDIYGMQSFQQMQNMQFQMTAASVGQSSVTPSSTTAAMEIPMDVMTASKSGYTMETSAEAVSTPIQDPVKQEQEDSEKQKKEIKIESLTVEDLLNIPLPKREVSVKKKEKKQKDLKDKDVLTDSPKPDSESTDALPVVCMPGQDNTAASIHISFEHNMNIRDTIMEEQVVEESIAQDDSMNMVQDMEIEEVQVETSDIQIHAEPPAVASEAKFEAEVKVKLADEVVAGTESEQSKGSMRNRVMEKRAQGKKYHFSWDDKSGHVSDVTVSSVHTSDLSSFEDDGSDIIFSDLESENRELTHIVPAAIPVPTEDLATDQEFIQCSQISVKSSISAAKHKACDHLMGDM